MTRILAVALNTGREAIRNKILYTIMLFAVLMTAIAGAFGSVSLGDSMKFVKDFSLFSLSLFGVVTTVVLGVNLLNNELQKRTIFNLLSKPVARWQFLVGKFVGLLATLTLMMAIMAAVLLGLVWGLEGRLDWTLLPVVAAMVMEIAVLLAVAIFFSSIVVTPSLTGLFTIAAFIAGRSTPWLAYFRSEEHPPLLRFVTDVLYASLPHLDRFYVADRVIAGQPLPAIYYLNLLLYTLAYTSVLLVLSAIIFRRREFV
jgi:ABC-type transport system involved in multi-copper enzyme maturation permease subunit